VPVLQLEPPDGVVRTVTDVVNAGDVVEKEVRFDANVTDDDVDKDDCPVVVVTGLGATVTKDPVPLMF